MQSVKQEIMASLDAMEQQVRKKAAQLNDCVEVSAYAELVEKNGEMEIWTDAFQKAINEHTVIRIPNREKPYYIDRSLTVPSNRRIEAGSQARICLTPDCDVLMLRNVHTRNGTHLPIPKEAPRDENISIDGGIWEESRTERMGYGKSGKYDKERSFFGVSTCLFFNQVDNLMLTNMTFVHAAGFAIQVGNLNNAVIENIRFDRCFADGVHVNGNTENLIVRHISGEVGDDLVGLNVYDWQNSSVNFGPGRNILCEDLTMPESCGYPAMRMEPGTYFYDDGTKVDCSLTRTIIRGVRGVRTFKLYFQTPAYRIGTEPERGDVGSCDDLFFEDITVDLNAPMDALPPYLESDPVRGSFAAFELGANINHISFENIRLTLHREKYPYSYLACIGPKSAVVGDIEVFDPYLSSYVNEMTLEKIEVNGQAAADCSQYLREIAFTDIDQDGHSTASGTIHRIIQA